MSPGLAATLLAPVTRPSRQWLPGGPVPSMRSLTGAALGPLCPAASRVLRTRRHQEETERPVSQLTDFSL